MNKSYRLRNKIARVREMVNNIGSKVFKGRNKGKVFVNSQGTSPEPGRSEVGSNSSGSSYGVGTGPMSNTAFVKYLLEGF